MCHGMRHEDATIRFLRVPEVSVRVQSLPPSTGVTKTEQPASRAPAIVPTQTEVILDPVCTTTQCHIESQWLRPKLDSTVDPCKDFYRYVCGSFRGTNQYIETQLAIEVSIVASIYKTDIPSTNQTSWQKVAALFKSCVSMQATNRTETEDLVEWMISLNLDLCNDTRLSTVDAVDMIVRCNLDFGLEVIFSITFHPIFSVGKMPAAHPLNEPLCDDLREETVLWSGRTLQQPAAPATVAMASDLATAGTEASALPAGVLAKPQVRTTAGTKVLPAITVFEDLTADMILGADFLLSDDIELTIHRGHVELRSSTAGTTATILPPPTGRRMNTFAIWTKYYTDSMQQGFV
ncbi:uncharacterized protein LOC142802928 [Rhipicephalus microplus]|uniref:uncharacterized protein LOC142802928 n=1 Tax=Rhipicephalus microplus TaxID=6941 RepID=UPI003F6AD385